MSRNTAQIDMYSEVTQLRAELKRSSVVIQEQAAHIQALQQLHFEHQQNERTLRTQEEQIKRFNKDMAAVERYLKEKETECDLLRNKYTKYKRMSEGLNDRLRVLEQEAKTDKGGDKVSTKSSEKEFMTRFFPPGVTLEQFMAKWAEFQAGLVAQSERMSSKGDSGSSSRREDSRDAQEKGGLPDYENARTAHKRGSVGPESARKPEGLGETKTVRQVGNSPSFDYKSEQANTTTRHPDLTFSVRKKQETNTYSDGDVSQQSQNYKNLYGKMAQFCKSVTSRLNKLKSTFDATRSVQSKATVALSSRLITLKFSMEKVQALVGKQKDEIRRLNREINHKTDEIENQQRERDGLKSVVETLKVELQSSRTELSERMLPSPAPAPKPLSRPEDVGADLKAAELWKAERAKLVANYTEQLTTKDKLIEHLQSINKQMSKLINEKPVEKQAEKQAEKPAEKLKKRVISISKAYNYRPPADGQASKNETNKKGRKVSRESGDFQRSSFHKAEKVGEYCDVEGSDDEDSNNSTGLQPIQPNHLLSLVSNSGNKNASPPKLKGPDDMSPAEFNEHLEVLLDRLRDILASKKGTEVLTSLRQNEVVNTPSKVATQLTDLKRQIGDYCQSPQSSHSEIQDQKPLDCLTEIWKLIDEQRASQRRASLDLYGSGVSPAQRKFKALERSVVTVDNIDERVAIIISATKAAFAEQKILELQVKDLKEKLDIKSAEFERDKAALQLRAAAAPTEADAGARRGSMKAPACPKCKDLETMMEQLSKNLSEAEQKCSRAEKQLASSRQRCDKRVQRLQALLARLPLGSTESLISGALSRLSTLKSKLVTAKATLEAARTSPPPPPVQTPPQTPEAAPPSRPEPSSRTANLSQSDANSTLELLLNEFKTKLVKAENANITLENEMAAIKTERNNLQNLLDDRMKSAQLRLQEANERNERLTKEVEILRKDCPKGDLRTQVKNLYIENDGLQGQVASLQDRLASVITDKETIETNFKIMRDEMVKLVKGKDVVATEFKTKEVQLRQEMSQMEERCGPYFDIGEIITDFLRIDITRGNMDRLQTGIRRMMDSEEFMIEMRAFFKNKLEMNLEREAMKDKIKEVALDWHLGVVQKHLNESRGSLIN